MHIHTAHDIQKLDDTQISANYDTSAEVGIRIAFTIHILYCQCDLLTHTLKYRIDYCVPSNHGHLLEKFY